MAAPVVRDEHSFLVLRENKLAFAAIDRLVRSARHAEGPRAVTLYGPAGAGKSHLVRHAVRTFRAKFPDERVLHFSAAEFAEELDAALSTKNLAAFLKKFRVPVGLLICEDLGPLAGRTPAQEQLIASWNDLAPQRTRMLFTADRPLGELQALAKRLTNRLQGGLVAAISRYGLPSRRKLLAHLAEARQMPLTDEQVETLAAPPSNGHELVGLVHDLQLRLKAQPNLDMARAIEQMLEERPSRKAPALGQIAKTVAAVFSARVADLRSDARDRRFAVPRQIAMLLMREVGGASLTEIGEYFGGRTHSTVLHACRQIQLQLESDEALAMLRDAAAQQVRAATPSSSASRKGTS